MAAGTEVFNGRTYFQEREIEVQQIYADFMDTNDEIIFKEHFSYTLFDDANAGIFQTKGLFDREVMARSLRNTVAPVTFNFTLISFSDSTTDNVCVDVNIHVVDENDNMPHFGVDEINVFFNDDNEALNQFRPLAPLATDDDEGVNGIMTYVLLDDLGVFNLDVTVDDDTQEIESVRLKHSVPLDREMQECYRLTLEASEGRPNGDVANVTVNACILDSCDESPYFDVSYYQPSLPENSKINTTIANITAYDDDLGTGGQVQYFIDNVCSKSSPQSNCQDVSEPYPFHLDMESGELVLDDELDREINPQFRVTVRAEDKCARTATATVEVTLEDVNDNPPTVTYSAANYNNDLRIDYVPESRTALSDLGLIAVTDPDLGVNGTFTVQLYELNSSTGGLFISEKFSINNETAFTLNLIEKLDHETVSKYTLVIIARDMGLPPLMSNYTFVIQVVDINDNPPIFTSIPSVFELHENALVNHLVVPLVAKDADSGNNGRVTYVLPPSDSIFRHQDLFTVDENAGHLKVSGSLDRETDEKIQVLVVAKDNPTSGVSRSTSIVVNITLLDQNDSPPEIISLGQTVSVSESQEPEYIISTIVVRDNDTEIHGMLTYTLGPGSGPFEIDSLGVIRLSSKLDFEDSPMHSLDVQVSDGVNDASQTIIVHVEDVNDEPPVINQVGPYVVTIAENQDSGQLVAQISATDPDTPTEDLIFTIVDGNMEHFRIESAGTGNVYTTVSLDRENVNEYTLYIRVSDGMHSSVVDARVDVVVGDENDHPPKVIGVTPLVFTISENALKNTVVGVVRAEDPDEGQNGMIRYDILDGNEDGLFAIDVMSGTITTTEVLDRELLTPPVFQLDIKIYDQGDPPMFAVSVTATVTILDENDNGPDFAESLVEIDLRENLGTGHIFLTVQASDPDIEPNNITIYSISPTSPASSLDLFYIDPDTGDLSLQKSLNFETETFHEFVVLAVDEETTDTKRQDSLTVQIQVIDTVDPILAFEENFPLSFELSEETSPAVTLYLFRVVDMVTGNPIVDQLGYRLTNLDGSVSQEFDIETLDSDVHARIYTLALDLDRENASVPDVFYLNVTVHDMRPPDTPNFYGSLSHGFTVYISDTNDNPPTFTAAQYAFSVDENEGVNTSIGTVHADDPDKGENKTVMYQIRGSVPFDIDSNTGHITALQPLDHEVKPEYIFYVIAQDQGAIPLSSEVSVIVGVNDLNDNEPVFDQNQNFIVPEDSEVGSIVATIGVTDLDSGSSGEVVVTVAPGSRLDSHFELKTTGEIVLIASLDHDNGETLYSFEARARDGGSPRKEVRAEINITVGDVNDNVPEFLNTTFSVTIPENLPVGMYFTTLVVGDQDTGINGEVRFVLADISLSHIFYVGPTTGSIQLRPQNPEDYPTGVLPPVIDYERTEAYDVEIIAYDRGIPRNFASRTLKVTVENINEFHPVFDKSLVTVYVDEGLPAGTKIVTLEAYDWDYDQIDYRITQQVPHGHFSWDSSSKSITTIRELDYSLFPSYFLELRATESVSSHNATIGVHVMVVNVNNHSPEFTEAIVSRTISEETEPGTVLLTAKATDEDNSTNDAVTYYFSLESGNDSEFFFINPLTGEISVSTPLDYEEQTEFNLFVLATDTGEEPRTSYNPLKVVISLTNENDELPVFTEPEYTLVIAENGEPELFVGQVVAVDRDLGTFGDVQYSLTGSSEYFTINAQTGEIFTQVTIDRESLDSTPLILMVTASDMGQPAKTASVLVNVVITDLNDNPPRFPKDVYLFSLPVEQAADVTFGTLDASDPDEGTNADFTYEIVSQDGSISVNISQTGALSLQSPGIPQDYQTVYNLVVRVTDSLDSAVFNEGTVRLIVEVEDDHHPWFTEQFYEVSILENSPLDDTIFDISSYVSDEDPGENGNLVYSLAPEALSAIFSVDSITGQVTLSSTLDFESTPRYELTLYATDSTPEHPRTASATLCVLVEDFNDWAPEYINPVTAITISTTPFSNIQLFNVHAEDRDSGELGDVGYSIDITEPLFEVNPVTGVVTNNGPLAEVGETSFVIRAYDFGHPLMSSNITVTVTIQDPGNDAPEFVESSPLFVTIPEDRAYPSIVEQFNTIRPADSFHIVYSNATEGTFEIDKSSVGGFLELIGELDYEEATKYILIVEARRVISGDRYSSFLELVVSVDDVNDNVPKFSHIGVETVSEAQDVDVPLFTVFATDADDGILGKVTYEFISGNNAKIFKIDADSGEVSLSRSLDREEREDGGMYELVVRASDGGVSDTQQDEITVIVEVLDVNDYPPYFESSSYEISVYESPHTSIGDRLIQLTAIDLDSGPRVRYDLFPLEASHGTTPRPADHITAFGIDVDTGVVTVEEQLDKESTDYYLFNVTATDTIITAWTLLHVRVLDVNDHYPMITAPSGDVEVYELLPVGSLVTKGISASDVDSGPNGGIIFSLGEGWPDQFQIHPQTGVIRIKEMIHYNPEGSHFIGEVIASDLGVPRKMATAEISVVVRDVNDHPPQFTQSSYDISLAIDTPVNTEIFAFIATDADYETNKGIMFKLPKYYLEARNLFFVDTDGTMRLNSDEAHDLRPDTYTFRVEAANHNAIPFAPQYVLASYADVTITVTDVNREKPIFDKEEYSTTIPEDFPVWEVVPGLSIFAMDADGDGILYSIDSPPGVTLPFSIDENSGNVTLTLDLDREEKDAYELLVVATDTGFPPETSNVTVTIEIGDVNDERPVFNASSYIGLVREHSVPGTFVLQVLATDRDLNEGGRVTYALESSYSNLPFEIDPISGIITVADDSIDYESELIMYGFQVIASDMGISPHSSTAGVTVNVLGKNEGKPEFVKKTYNFEVAANAQVNDVIGIVTAVDEDGGEEGRLTYSFKNNAPEDYFRIDTVNGSGVIILIASSHAAVAVDEPQKRQVVEEGFFLVTAVIVAADNGESPDSGEATVYIKVPNSFTEAPVVTTSEPQPDSPPLEIIAVVVGVVVVVVVAFVAVLVAACICRMKRKKGKAQITDTMNNVEMQQRFSSSRASGSYTGTPSTTQLRHHNATAAQNVLNHSQSGSDSSQHSYGGYAGDEDSLNGEGHAVGYSPSLPRKSPGTRSTTSDLASTVGTEMLANASQEAPYPKAQIMAIYAANRELLDDGSQDSVHNFVLEGGGEADGALDIDTILLSKYHDIDDEDTMAEDDASILGKEPSVVTDSSSHLDIRPMEESEDPFQYSQSMLPKGWIPRGGSISGTIDQLISYADSQEDPEPMHRRQMYPGSYEHSQGTSFYGGALSQNSRMALLPHQQKPLPDDYHYYHDHHSEDPHHHSHLPPRSHRFTSSASALSGDQLSDHRPMPMDRAPLPRHLHYSQEIPHPSYHHGQLRYVPGRPHTPTSSTTPTEGTITPNTALAQDYDQIPVYLSSSSSTSLASTNIGIPRGARLYHPHHHH